MVNENDAAERAVGRTREAQAADPNPNPTTNRPLSSPVPKYGGCAAGSPNSRAHPVPLSAFPRSTQEGEESAPLSIVENGPQQEPRAMLEPDWTASG